MNRFTSIAQRLKSLALAATLACGFALPAAQAATVTLQGITTGQTCTYASATTDSSGNVTYVCQGGSVEPPPPPPPPPPPADGSALCALSASPAKSVYAIGETVSLTGNCQNAIGVLLVNGAATGVVGASITHSALLQTKGAFVYELIGTNSVNQHIASVTINVADPNDSTPPPGGTNCPTVSTVGPRAGFTDIGNLRFDLKPGEIGSTSWTFPNAGRRQLKIGTIFGTISETPYGTDVQVSVSECPGQFTGTSVPVGCVGNYSRNGGSLYVGDTTECTLEDDKTYYVNLRHVKYLSSPAVNSCVAPPFGYCTHYTRFNSF